MFSACGLAYSPQVLASNFCLFSIVDAPVLLPPDPENSGRAAAIALEEVRWTALVHETRDKGVSRIEDPPRGTPFVFIRLQLWLLWLPLASPFVPPQTDAPQFECPESGPENN